jgi:NAD(P)-dependent dehydrogenase (short-subunit alcohol dehydrogenase family)
MGNRLSDQVAIVTGAGKGIGKSIALGLANEGAHICIATMTLERANETKIDVEKLNRKAIAVAIDVSKQKDVQLMVEKTLKVFGKIDILVNNAGIARYTPFLKYTADDWNRTIDVNLNGYFYCAQAVAEHMVSRKKGKIINISSVAGQIALPNSVAYSASKGGIDSFTRVLALELAPYGICVNAIAPGPIMTPMAIASKEDKIAREAMIPMGRYGIPEDIVGPTIFLASSDSNFVTGQILYVDGGFLISGLPRKV